MPLGPQRLELVEPQAALLGDEPGREVGVGVVVRHRPEASGAAL